MNSFSSDLRVPSSLSSWHQLFNRQITLSTRPQLFKRWITLSIGYISIHWIVQSVLLILIHWIVIYPVNSAIHLLSNQGLINSIQWKVSLAVFSIVTLRSSPGALRDDTKNGCEGRLTFHWIEFIRPWLLKRWIAPFTGCVTSSQFKDLCENLSAWVLPNDEQ